MQENRVNLAFQESSPMVSLYPFSSFKFIVHKQMPGGKVLLYPNSVLVEPGFCPHVLFL